MRTWLIVGGIVAVVFGGIYASYNTATTEVSGGLVPVKNYCSFWDYFFRKCNFGVPGIKG